MKVACPHCSAAYTIDDRRVPATGLNVRCPKCRNAFPVKKDAGAEASAGAVPLPAPAGAAVEAAAGGSPFAPAPVPLPAPAFGAPPARSSSGAVPLPPPPDPDPFAALAADLDAPPPEPVFAGAEDAGEPTFTELAPPALAEPEVPVEDPPTFPERQAPADTAFGDVDFTSSPSSEASPADPFTSAAPPPPAPPVASGAHPPPSEELEMLFGDGAAGAAKAASAGGRAAGFRVRRRSGKVFGPFDAPQIVEMLAKGELMGNEDVSSDDGASWSPIGAVASFGEALRKSPGEPGPVATAAGAKEMQSAVPFGDRMAAAKLVEGTEPAPKWRRFVLPAAAVAAVLALGIGAGFTRFGFFFLKAFRRGDASQVTALMAGARAPLERAEYPADRAALESAARAVAADPDSAPAAALHAMVVAALEVRHGAPSEALDQARRAADRLEADAKGKLTTLATRLAVTLATSPGPATLPHETALEQALAKASPDAELVALLARAALARGDAPRASALYTRLDAMKPRTVRAAYGAALAHLARRDLAGAKAGFDQVLAATPSHLPARLELAAIAESAGDLGEAEAQLVWLLAAGAEAKLAPSELARALGVRAALLARVSSKAAEAEKAYVAGVDADPRLLEVRIGLARHRLRHGDAAGAVTALEPVSAQAVEVPVLAAVRIRALAAAGRALDASSLADLALAKNPGDSALTLAKAGAVDASGKTDEAVQLYKDAAARDPSAFEPRVALARIALGRRDFAGARVELAGAVEKGPREPATHALLGELAAAQGELAAAEKAFQVALGLDREFAPAEIGLARLALARGDSAGARSRLERAVAVDPRNVEGHVALGTILWKAKDLAGADRELQAAVDLQPRNALALSRLGAVQLERGADLDVALQRLTAATNEDARLAEARQWLGRALLKKGETPAAITQLRKAVELEPRDPEHHLYLGMALERSGAPMDAVEAYRASAAADPKYADAHERLGALYASNARFEDAAAAYDRAIAATPKVSRLRIALADCTSRLGKHEDAARMYREILKADPAAVQVFYKLARALHEAQGEKAALPWYERAAHEDRDNPMPHYYLGYLFKERGQKAKAVAEFKRFLALKPDADEKKDIQVEIEDLGGAR